MINKLTSHQCLLGEGPIYDPRCNTFYFIDIEGRMLHYMNPESKTLNGISLPKKPGTVVLCKNKDHLLLFLSDGLYLLDLPLKKLTFLFLPIQLKEGFRFNDGKVSPYGDIMVGIMNDEKPMSTPGQLLQISKNFDCHYIDTYYIPNGMAWDLAKEKYYCADSKEAMIYVYDYDQKTGAVANKTPLLDFTQESGIPDGLTINNSGELFIAHWSGSKITKWNPSTKEKLEEYSLPAFHITSCCFYNTTTLLVTTASIDVPDSHNEYSGYVYQLTIESDENKKEQKKADTIDVNLFDLDYAIAHRKQH